jgi:hypothetical protein
MLNQYKQLAQVPNGYEAPAYSRREVLKREVPARNERSLNEGSLRASIPNTRDN